jgi:hypothetical protein
MKAISLTLGVTANRRATSSRVAVEGRLADGTTIVLAPAHDASLLAHLPPGCRCRWYVRATPGMIDQLRVTLKLRDASSAVRLRHLALHPPA